MFNYRVANLGRMLEQRIELWDPIHKNSAG